MSRRVKSGFRAWSLLMLLGLALTLIGCRAKETAPPPIPHVPATATASNIPTPTTAPGEPLAARVNGQPIYLKDYEKQVSEWAAAFVAQNPNLNAEEQQAMLAQGKQQVLNVMIEQLLIEQAAAREGVTVSEQEIDGVIARDIAENGGQAQFEAWLKTNNWTVDEYKIRQRSMMIASQMFERVTRNVPTKAEQVHARHILVASEQQARDLLTLLQSGADFAALAAQHSLDPSTKDSGGDLGFFPRGTLVVPEVEDAAFALDVAQISDVTHSAMGYHIIQVLERVQDMALTEESWQALKETTFRKWLSELWAAATVEVLISI